MALNIKNPETERLARELARRRRQGITEAVTEVLRKELERERKRVRPRKEADDLVRAIAQIAERASKLPVLDTRSEDEILGYNEQGYCD